MLGMVAFTSADYLRLSDNARFNAIPHAAPDQLLSAAPVAAFGFLGSNPGAITVQGSQLYGGRRNRYLAGRRQYYGAGVARSRPQADRLISSVWASRRIRTLGEKSWSLRWDRG